MKSLFTQVAQCLFCHDLDQKCFLSEQIQTQWDSGQLSLEKVPLQVQAVGRPAQPELVLPKQLPKRSMATTEGLAAMVHAIAHIEFNAINLAWDAIYRFQELPQDYYDDWVRVAAEEAYHFSLVQQHLNDLGYQYGDFPAHNGLWEMVEETAYDVLARMALVPRVLEARGLDVTPGLMKKFTSVGDVRMSEILAIILRDEVGHVAVGSRWFHYLCKQRQLDPFATFMALLGKHFTGQIKGPFSLAHRAQAGFTEDELAWFAQR